MREVRRDPQIRSSYSADSMTVDAGRRLKQGQSFCGSITCRCLAWLQLSTLPFFELGRLFGDNKDAHPGMLRSAKLRALADVSARFVRLQPDVVRLTRHIAHLASQLRHPEFV